MKILNLTTLTAIALAGAVFSSCTKANRSDDFPAGDTPPTAGGFTNSSEIAPSNLIAYWGFNGDLKESVSGTTGTNKGMTFSAGLKGQAITGNPDPAAKAYATSPLTPAIAGLKKYTVSVWTNSALNTGATGIFSIGETTGFWANINIFFENGGSATTAIFKTIFLDNGATYDNATQSVANGFGNWTHYVITYDGAGNFKSYVNGSLARARTIPATDIRFTNVGPVIFGTLHFMTVPSSTTGSTDQPWAGYIPGKIDEVRIYNRALTDIEVSALSILERRGN
ncbi:MAG: LamG domain-containing protein [Bacteroidota bacterium]|nr:LamG domain-containing protein [Bacteroidota bacterium]